MEDGGFTIVAKGSKRCAKPKKGSGPSYSPSSSVALDADSFEAADVLRGVSDALSSLRGSPWISSLRDIVLSHVAVLASQQPASTRPEEASAGTKTVDSKEGNTAEGWFQDMVCYGFGHIGGNRTAQLQAAVALLLKEELRIGGEIQLFDPVLTEKEKEGARRLGFTVVEVNEVGLHSVAAKTLFFMPHCGRRLYSNVLRANWGVEGLGRVTVVGNCFSSYRLRLLSGPAAQSCLVAALGETLLETPLPPAPKEPESFADMAVHSFPPQVLEGAGAGRVWEEVGADCGGDDHGWA